MGAGQGPGRRRVAAWQAAPLADDLRRGLPRPLANRTETLRLVGLRVCGQDPTMLGGHAAHDGHEAVQPRAGRRPNQHQAHACSVGSARDCTFPTIPREDGHEGVARDGQAQIAAALGGKVHFEVARKEASVFGSYALLAGGPFPCEDRGVEILHLPR